jgi:phage gp29-like protein
MAVNPLLIRSPNDLLYDYALSSAYRSAWVYDPDFALAKDPDIWEVVRRDPVVASAIDRRCRNIIRPWRIEPPKNSRKKEDKLAAAICEEALLSISLFDQARYRMAQSSAVGRVYEYIEGRRVVTSLADTPEMEWWIPTRLVNIDRRRFHWVAKEEVTGPLEERRRETHLSMYNSVINRWQDVQPDFRAALIEIVYNNTEDRVGYGRSLLEATYFYHYMKTVTMEKIAQGIDRWANGILIGHLDSLRNASTGKTNEDLRKGMKTLLQNMRSEHIAVFEKGDELQVVETSGAGHEISMNFIHYLDEGIERLYNGSIMPSGFAEGSGSRARAETESDTSEAFYQFDRSYLDEVLTRDLVGLFWRQNYNNLFALGLGIAKMPRFHSEQQKKEDPLMAVQVATQLLQNNVPLVKSEVYHKAGYSVPEPDDEVIEGVGQKFSDEPFGNEIGKEAPKSDEQSGEKQKQEAGEPSVERK